MEGQGSDKRPQTNIVSTTLGWLSLTRTMAESAPSAEDRSRYETIRKELISALPKKRAIDKQLVRKHTKYSHLTVIQLSLPGPNRSSDTYSGSYISKRNSTTQWWKHYPWIWRILEESNDWQTEVWSSWPGSDIFKQQFDCCQGVPPSCVRGSLTETT
jgi:hypothetical protein